MAWLTPPTAALAELAAQRTLWEQHGFVAWAFAWSGGEHPPSGSLTFAPLAALVGERVVGAVGGALACGLFVPLSRALLGTRGATAAAGLFTASVACCIAAGWMPLVLALALAVGAALTVMRWHLWLAALLAFAAALTSPLAALLLVLVALAWWAGMAAESERTRAGWGGLRALAAPALLGGGVLVAFFMDLGEQRFAAALFWPALALSLLSVAALPMQQRVARVGAGLGALLLIAAYVAPSPFGEDVLRYGTLLGPPFLVGAALRCGEGGRRTALTALAAGWVVLALQPAVRAVVDAREDRTTERAYFAPLDRALARYTAPGDRIELPATRNRWEAAYVAPRFALVRGTSARLDDVPDRSAARYRRWLVRERVRWVALPGRSAELEDGREAELIRSGRVRGLRPVARAGEWTLYAVRGVRSVDGPGRIVRATPTRIVLRADRAGTLRLRGYRHSRWLRPPARRGPGGTLEVRARRAGIVAVRARIGG